MTAAATPTATTTPPTTTTTAAGPAAAVTLTTTTMPATTAITSATPKTTNASPDLKAIPKFGSTLPCKGRTAHSAPPPRIPRPRSCASRGLLL
jgi:hypothetical protein